jgi:hypothetical protein
MSTGTTCTTQNGYFLRGIENFCKLCNFFFRRTNYRLGLLKRYEWSAGNSFLQRNISWQNNDGDST